MRFPCLRFQVRIYIYVWCERRGSSISAFLNVGDYLIGGWATTYFGGLRRCSVWFGELGIVAMGERVVLKSGVWNCLRCCYATVRVGDCDMISRQ